MRSKWRVLAPACLLIVIVQFLYFRHGSGQLLAIAIRGNTQCPLALTLQVGDEAEAFRATVHRMKRASKLLEKDGTLELWDTPRGRFWMPEESAPLIPIVLAEQEHEIYGKGARSVQPGDVVLDCGADIGTFTRSALSHGAGKVVAIDPGDRKDLSLRRNFANEIAAGRVVVVNKGVWDKVDTLRFKGDSLVGREVPGALGIPVTTIDLLVEELGLPRVDFIKMDIEGAEKPALEGARATVRKFRPRISIASEHYSDDAVAIPRLLRSMVSDYKMECGPCEWADNQIRPKAIYLF